MGSNTGKCPLLDNFFGYVCDWVKLGNTIQSLLKRSLECFDQESWNSGEPGGSVFSQACANSALPSSECSQTYRSFFFLLLFIVCPILFFLRLITSLCTQQIFFFFLCLLKDALLSFPCLLFFNLRSLKLFNYSYIAHSVLIAESWLCCFRATDITISSQFWIRPYSVMICVASEAHGS